MKISGYILIIVGFLLMSCGEDKNTIEVIESETTEKKSAITVKAIESFDYTDYALSLESQEVVADWKEYNEFATQIEYLKKADLSFFRDEKKELKKVMDQFNRGIPSQLRTNPIVSRLVIIETAVLKLNENLTIDNIDDSLKLQSVKDVLLAFSNCNYQINKKIERDIYDKIRPE